MERYEGISNGDSISNGGSYIAEHGFGHEIFNFLQYRESVFGYAQLPAKKDRWSHAKFNLKRIAASADGPFLKGVLVIWVATSPSRGAFIVGWYRNATVYRDWQPAPHGSARHNAQVECGYFATASGADAVLLSPDERVFSIPQGGAGKFGQANVWYADDPLIHETIRRDVLKYIETRRLVSSDAEQRALPRQLDPLLRLEVERRAVLRTIAHFEGIGYNVQSVERDNCGWDLTATLSHRELRLEVKGLSGDKTLVELTPNEFRSMREYQEAYRLCILTQALSDESVLEIFHYSREAQCWMSDAHRRLKISEQVAARCEAV